MQPLRSYQQWFFDETLSDDGNIVIIAPTGAGKTRVAFEVIFAARLKHPSRKICFVSPTVPLAQQQFAYFINMASARAGVSPELAGRRAESEAALVVGGSGARLEEDATRVYFCTPAKLLAYVDNSSHRAFERMSLLVLDECHHSVRSSTSSASGESKHP
jgi:ERCC4-related helicase